MTTAADCPPRSRHRSDRRLYPSRFHWRWHIQTLMSRHLEAMAQAHFNGRRDLVLIDYGCGAMPYRPIFERYVWRYIGADLPDNEHAEVRVNGDGRLDVADASADVVLSTQVLEHVADPERYLDECRRVLRPGGRLMLSTHGMWWYHPHPNDYWRWTAEGLRKLLTDADFRVDELRGLMSLAAAGMHLTQDGVYRRVPRFVRPMFFFVMQNLVWLLDRLGDDQQRTNDAGVYVAMCTRP